MDVWLESALDKISAVGVWVHGIWFASIPGLMLIFGNDATRIQAAEFFLVRT